MTLVRKKGFTLVELSIGMGIAASLALVSAQEKKFETYQDKARALGNEIHQYNSAVSRYLAENSKDPSIVGTKTDTKWLKDSTACADGEADISYLVCEALPDGKTLQFGISPRTIISNEDGIITAKTVWDTVIGDSGEPDAMVMGVAALTASGGYMSQAASGGSGYQSPTVYCHGAVGENSSIKESCGTVSHAIVSTASNHNTAEQWLRTDHTNTMKAALEFDVAGDVTEDDQLKLAENRSDDSWLRQIVSASRIYNGVSPAGQSLTLGAMTGNSIYSDAFITSNNLLSGSVIMDGNLAAMNDFFVKADAFIEGNLEVAGNISTDGQITSEGDMISKGDIKAEERTIKGGTVRSVDDVMSGRDILATRNVKGKAFFDKDDETKYVDPASRSQINALTVNNTGTSSLVVGGRIRTNEYLHLNKNVAVGNYCSPNGLIGRIPSGKIANCVNNKWESSGRAGVSKVTSKRIYPKVSGGAISFSTPQYLGIHDFCAVAGNHNGKNSQHRITGAKSGDSYVWYIHNGGPRVVEVNCFRL